MVTFSKYRQIIYLTGALLTGLITGWAVLDGAPMAETALSVLIVFFFLGGVSDRIYDTIPNYQHMGAIAIGAAAIGVFLLGHEREMLIGLVIIGMASAIDLVSKFVRSDPSSPN